MKILFSVVVLVLVFGCDVDKRKKELPSSKSYNSFSLNETLLKVGGQIFTKNDCERDAELAGALKSRVAQFRNLEISLRDKEIVCGNFIVFASVRDKIEKQKLNLKYQVNSNKLIRLRRQLGKRNERLFPALEVKLKREAEISSYVDYVLADSINVTSNEIAYIHHKIRRYNETAQMTNALVYAHATNVWKQVISSGEFDKYAQKYDERPEHGGPGEWGVFDASQLEGDGDLLSVVRATPEGAVTSPIEADGGLLIVKVVKKMGAGPKVAINNDPERFELKRIFFQLPVFYKTETYEETYNNILNTKKKRRAKEIIDEVVKSSKIQYPNGNIIWKQ